MTESICKACGNYFRESCVVSNPRMTVNENAGKKRVIRCSHYHETLNNGKHGFRLSPLRSRSCSN